MAQIKVIIEEQKYQKPLVYKEIGNTDIEELIDRAFIYLKKKYGRII